MAENANVRESRVTPPIKKPGKPGKPVAEPTYEVSDTFAEQQAYLAELRRINQEAATAAANAPSAKNNYDIFKSELTVAFGSFGPNDDSWIREIFNAGKTKMMEGNAASSIPDMLLEDPTLVNYRSRFKGLLDLKERAKTQKVSYIPTIAEYVTAERTNTQLLQRYGLNDMANQKVLDSIFAGDVSSTELEERIVVGYNAITNADTALKQQLATEFPTLNNTDFLQALLSGADGAKVLERKVARAGISAEAATAGIQSMIGSEELVKSGVTREQARKGFQAVSQLTPGIQQAGRMFGDVEVGTLQTELEKEALLGQTSKRTKALASQSRAQFGGSSGIVTGSLSRKKQV